MQRMIALIILLIPGIFAAYGIKLMRDMLFGLQADWIPYLWLQFILGFLLFALGLFFIGGFLLRRDRKNNRVQERFKRPEVQKKDPR